MTSESRYIIQEFQAGRNILNYFSPLDPACPLIETRKYKKQLGEGGSGYIYEFEEDTIDGPKVYAIKVIPTKTKYIDRYTCRYEKDILMCGELAMIPEFIISYLVAELYRSGRCIVFSDVYYMLSCPQRSYLFEERLHPPGKTEKILQRLAEEDVSSIFLQCLFGIAAYQTYYRIAHTDLSFNNILLEPITADMSYNGSPLMDADYLHFRVFNKDYYIRTCPYIVKIIDWGAAEKFSDPQIHHTDYTKLEYESMQSDVRSLIFRDFIGSNIHSDLLLQLAASVLQIENSPRHESLMSAFLKNTDLEVPLAIDILLDDGIMKPYLIEPGDDQIVVSIGYIE